MKLFSKMLLAVILIVCLSLGMSGYLLMAASMTDAVERETKKAIDSYQVVRFIFQSGLANSTDDSLWSKGLFADVIPAIIHANATEHIITVLNENKELLYSEFPGSSELLWTEPAQADALSHRIQHTAGNYYLNVAGTVQEKSETLTLVVSTDITPLFERQQQMERNYRLVYIGVCTVSLLATVVLITFWLRPVKRMSHTAALIAGGDYQARVPVCTKDELGELADSFNAMADEVETNMEQLRRNAIEKEDFVANFAHELKTPLTSVIGYADMLTRKPMEPEQVKEAAQYILDEGMRLESLSFKLMELVVLHKQDFIFERLSARDIFRNVQETLHPILIEKKVDLTIEIEDADLSVEFDLFKTMMLNLADNAVKADSSLLHLTGTIQGERYMICLSDNGRGIPDEALERITEAFYMFDKSRSRKQHGAGIGLALVARIAELHHAELRFESAVGAGTTVYIGLPLEKGGCP